ncbi:MAG: FxSxx-COOH system tetratricopeptide repeat protein [Acidobacteriota bacterium]|nr:FxSxx-COOH system tetratricopeptide repeat protein [Acidobacteriota bacterium]
MRPESKKNFFISFNKADRAWAAWIAWQLEAAGYTTIFQDWDFRPGGNFVLDMQRAAALAERTVAVLSPDYLGAKFTQPEWAVAFAQDPTGEKGKLVPVLVRECNLEGLLPQIVHVNLVGLPEPAAKSALLGGVRGGRAKPEEEPAFPPDARRSVTEEPRFPGALPPVWNVPHNRNPHFTGREDFLSALERALASGRPAALTQALHGLGGVGKTQLATEYAYRNSHLYKIVWWVRSEEPATLASDYANLAAKLGLAEANEPNQGLIVEAVRRWFEHNTGWLLIFDNANRRDEIRDYLPRGSTGHVIITSRDRDWKGVAQPLQVREMPRPEAVAFLLKRTSQTDADSAAALADELGDLPLALEQAGAYIDATGETLASYLELFRAHHQRLLSRGTPSTNYPATVATTWDISFAEVRKQSPVSEDLINLCAFFAPDDIPLDIIRAGSEFLPDQLGAAVTDPLAFDDALAPLLRYSLAERRGQSLFIHRLVQAVVRERLREAAKKQWAVSAVHILNNAFPYVADDVRVWPACSTLLPHALVAAEHSQEFQEASMAAQHLFNQAGVYLRARADFAQARSSLERALRILELAGHDESDDMAAVLSNLGNVLGDLMDLDGALACQQRSLKIRLKVHGENHDGVVIGLNNLGMVMLEQGDLEGARVQFEQAIELGEGARGVHHPVLATPLNNLGVVMRRLGDLAGARLCYERALAINEAIYGEDHPSVALAVNNLGLVLFLLGDSAGARNCFARALQTFTKYLGEEHPHTVQTKKNLAHLPPPSEQA